MQKFGGSVLATREDFLRVAEIIEVMQPDAVVVSAVAGMTDALISLLEEACAGRPFSQRLFELRQAHEKIVGGKVPEIGSVFDALEKQLNEVSWVGEYSERLFASFVSRGEYLAALALQSFLPEYAFWPSEKGFVAEGNYLKARFDFARCSKPPGKSIVTGFYAMNSRGEPVLFGRGGSDYTAACLARLMGASKLEFWKNVDGFMSANPTVTRKARFIPKMSLEEAGELCRFGAKILQPYALEPLAGSGTAVEIKNAFNPSRAGTVIANGGKGEAVVAVAGKEKIAVIHVFSNGMVDASGVASEILSLVARAGVVVDVIATAQASISFTVEEGDAEKARTALKGHDGFEVSITPGLSLVAVVGRAIREDPAFTSRAFNALAGNRVGVQMISRGMREVDLSIVVKREHYRQAVESIHDEFLAG